MVEVSEIEKKRIKEIDLKLSKLQSTYEAFVPIFYNIDRKMKSIKLEIHSLEEEKMKLSQGQIMFDDSF